MAFSPDGDRFASADSNGRVRILSTASLYPLIPDLAGHQLGIASLAFDPTGSMLATADALGTVRFWDTSTGALIHRPLTDHASIGIRLAFTPAGLLLTGPVDGWVVLLDPASGEIERQLIEAGPDEYTAFAVWLGDRDNDDIRLAGGSRAGTLTFWQDDGRGLISGTGAHDQEVTSVAFNNDGTLVFSGALDGTVRRFNAVSGEALGGSTVLDTRAVGGLAPGLDGSYLFLAGWSGFLGIVPIEGSAGELAAEVVSPGPDRLTAITTTDSGKKIAVGGDDGSVSIWHDASASIFQSLDLPDPSTVAARARPAEGVLLSHEQTWTMEGIALGELVHSVNLAPGEVTQIAISNHTRRLYQDSLDAVSQQEELSQRRTASGDLDESEQLAVDESSFGFSTQSTTSTTLGGGFSAFGLSAGGSHTSATSTGLSFSSGNRSVSDESNQSVHQRSMQQAREQRAQHGASIREVSEGDALELRTRVLTNYNHMHALNMQYYEVIGVQRLTTRVVSAERLIFIPASVIEFVDDAAIDRVLNRFPHEVADTLRGLGKYGPATCVDYLLVGRENSSTLRNHRLSDLWERMTGTENDRISAESALPGQRTDERNAHRAVLTAQDALRSAEDPGLSERDRLQAELRAARQQAERFRKLREEAEVRAAELGRASRALGRVRDQVLSVLRDAEISVGTATAAPELDRADEERLLQEVRTVLLEHQLEINQGLWMRLDPTTWASMLAGYSYQGEALGPSVDPRPVAVTGNLVGFRWSFANAEDEAVFRHLHLNDNELYSDAVSIPTGGLFGEAVLGQSNTADKVDITRFWNWKDSLPPIRPTEIGPLHQPNDDQPLAAPKAPRVEAPTIDLGDIKLPQVTSSLDAVSAILANPDTFRDLSGMDTSAALAQSAIEMTKSGSVEAAQLAGENYRRHLQFQQKVIDSVFDAANKTNGSEFDPTMAGAVLNEGELGSGRHGTESGESSTGSGRSGVTSGLSGEQTRLDPTDDFTVTLEKDAADDPARVDDDKADQGQNGGPPNQPGGRT